VLWAKGPRPNGSQPGTSGDRGPLAGRNGVEALPRDRSEALAAEAGTHQEGAETLLQRGPPSATIGWSRTQSRNELAMLALSHELSIAEPGDLAIGF